MVCVVLFKQEYLSFRLAHQIHDRVHSYHTMLNANYKVPSESVTRWAAVVMNLGDLWPPEVGNT